MLTTKAGKKIEVRGIQPKVYRARDHFTLKLSTLPNMYQLQGSNLKQGSNLVSQKTTM